MFLHDTINELIYNFNKITFFIFFFILFSTLNTPPAYAEEKENGLSVSEEKIRKAVVNQLLLLGGKSKEEEKKGVVSTKKIDKPETKFIKKTEKKIIKKKITKKKVAITPVVKKEDKKQATPDIESLTDKEVQNLMLDIIKSSDQVRSKKESESQNKTVATKSKNKVNAKKTSVKQVELSQDHSTKTTIMSGWIYLGRFKANKWENKTLNIDKELPKIGQEYAVKTTMVHVRDALPKKGKMGHPIKIIKTKAKVKILKLYRLGKNKDYYWAKITY